MTLLLPVKKAPKKADMAQLPVVHAHNILPVPMTDVTPGHVTNVTSGHVTGVTSGHVTSGSTTA